MAYQESLLGKYEVWRGWEVKSTEKERKTFRDIVMEHKMCRQAEKNGE